MIIINSMSNDNDKIEDVDLGKAKESTGASAQGTIPKVRNAVLELCNRLQRRAIRMRDRRLRRAKSKRHSYRDPANW